MPTTKEVLRHFSNETTLHGFKRLWIGSRWRCPFWLFLIIVGLSLCIYQIKNKAEVLIKNPLSININLEYKDELEFPAVTVCSTLKVRVSFLVNSSFLLNAINIMYPIDRTNLNITEKDTQLLQALDAMWTTKEFFEQAGLPKEQLILWCRLPNGQACSSDDFEPIITGEGFCYKLNKRLVIKEAGPGSALKLLLNIAQYEVTPNSTSAGVRVIVHERDQAPIPSSGYDLMPGYQTSIILRKTITKQLGNCESENPLKYYAKYTYPVCQIEQKLLDTSVSCQCKLYTLPNLVDPDNKNASIDSLEECTLSKHFTCVESIWQERATVITNETEVDESSTDSKCIGECVREEFEKEHYYNVFKDASTFRSMIAGKAKLITEAYQDGRDADAYLKFFRHTDDDYRRLLDASNGLEDLIYKRRLVPPFGTVTQLLMETLPCLQDIMDEYGKNNSDTRTSVKSLNNSLPGLIINTITDLDPKLEALEINSTMKYANSLKKVHLDACSSDNREICSLGALYDLFKLRAQLEVKNEEIKVLLNGSVRNLTEMIENFVQENGTLFTFFKQTSDDDKRALKQMLEYYVNQISFCLMETSRTYEKILNNGQPSMKTTSTYNNFLSDLNYVNLTLYGTCKKGGLVVDTLFNVTNRQELAFKIIHFISHGESAVQDTIKAMQFKEALIAFADDMEKKLSSSDYDIRLLNTSLYDIETMDHLLNKYIQNEGTGNGDKFQKSSLYDILHASNDPFREGIIRYRSIVTIHIVGLTEFFTKALEKLIITYPGSDTDLWHAQSVMKPEDFSLNFTELPTSLQHIMCLKKTKMALGNIESKILEPAKLDLYMSSVNDLVNSLKLYVEDIKSLKRFYDENLGLVQISFRDMGVKESIQERTYDFLSFLCDVGGVVGLWLGGSMLSLFEVFDLLFFENMTSYCLCCKKRLRRPPSPSFNNKGENFDLPVVHPESQEVQMVAANPLNNGEADVYKPATWRLYYDKS